MSLSRYQDLRAAIADWTQRDDVGVRSDDFIALVEADVNRRLRTRNMLTRLTQTVGLQYSTLPTGFLEMHRLLITSETPVRELEFVTPQKLGMLKANLVAEGRMKYYSIIGTQMEFLPAPTEATAVEALYFKKITPLDTTNTSNWLLSDWPDCYLHGCLYHAFVYVFDEQRAAFHKERYEEALEEIKVQDRNGRAGQRPVVRTSRSFGNYQHR